MQIYLNQYLNNSLYQLILDTGLGKWILDICEFLI